MDAREIALSLGWLRALRLRSIGHAEQARRHQLMPSSLYSKVMMMAESEGPGRYVCPACQGGSSGEVSLSIDVTENEGVLWHCFRNSCHFAGRKKGSNLVRTKLGQHRERSIRPFTGELRELTEGEEDFLLRKIGFNDCHLIMSNVMYAPEYGRFAFPIYGPLYRRGWLLRSYDGSDPKALTFMTYDEPHISYYYYSYNRPESPVVVVEDIPSAVRVSPYLNSAALLGTGCPADYAQEIATYFNNVVWALDPDALKTALHHHRAHDLLFDSSMVLPLPRDPKDMDEDELSEFMERIVPEE